MFSIFDNLTFYLDSRLLWDFQGSLDGLSGLSNAMKGTEYEAAVENAIQKVNDVKTYKYDFRTNISLSYKLSTKHNVQFYVVNLFGANNNKRYSYDNGNDDPAPTGVRFIEEPRVWGLNISFRF